MPSPAVSRYAVPAVVLTVLALIWLQQRALNPQYENTQSDTLLDISYNEKRYPDCRMPKRPVFHGQSGEDLALFNRYFAQPVVCDGTFVEIGALDGLQYSNTKFFEDQLGWNGVLIEAEPNNIERLMTNRPGTKNFGMAVCPEGQKEVEFIGGAAVGGVVEHMLEQHKKSYINEDMKAIMVPCEPMSSILREAEVTKIDLFSLDVEGAELMVLQTMDWSIPVRVWVIEMARGDQDHQVIALLREHGYKEAAWNIMDHCPHRGDCAPNVVFENTNYMNYTV